MIMKKRVLNGIDRIDEVIPSLSGARIALITNPTGVSADGRSTVDILHEKGLLYCLLAPEHGVRGTAQAGEHIAGYTDERTGVAVHSLYGSGVHIPESVLESIDAVAVDIQDVGARFYTYTSTLAYAMEDCARFGKRMIVFDRINPIGAVKPEGSVLEKKFSSFVGRYETATRHNLTVGEYANYINATENIGCELVVVTLDGWERGMHFSDTSLEWICPSPNIKRADTCFYYIGTCLAEGLNLSEGRGTEKPFELVGAPWLNAEMIAEELNARHFSGVSFASTEFIPSFSKYSGERCNGVLLHMTNAREFLPFETALSMLELIRRTHKEFRFTEPQREGSNYFVDLLLGSDEWRNEDFDINAFLKKQNKRLDEYEQKIKKYYLY